MLRDEEAKDAPHSDTIGKRLRRRMRDMVAGSTQPAVPNLSLHAAQAAALHQNGPVALLANLVNGLILACLLWAEGIQREAVLSWYTLLMLAIVWLWLRRDCFRQGWVGFWHALLLNIALLIPLAPWLARMLEGRLEEAFALVPVYNLVSRPESGLSYLLFHWHRMLIAGFLVLLGIHVAAALFHAFVLKDKLLSRMFFWRDPS